MRKAIFTLGCILGLAAAAGAQTTTFNGVLKDLTQTPVATGQVQFQLRPGITDTTISGGARFVPTTIFCEIHNPSITSTTSTGTTVTVNLGTAQTWSVGDSLVFAGTADAALNNTVATAYSITVVNSTTSFTFALTGTHNNGAGGTAGGLYKSGGTGACQVTQNTAITPANTSYNVSLWPSFSQTASFNTYAIGTGPVDISTIVPTPGQQPAYSFADTFSNQTIAGNKTFSGNNNFTGTQSFAAVKTLARRVFADACTGADWGAQVNTCAASLCPAGGIVDATGFTQGSVFTVTSAPFAGINCPITLLTGNYTVQWNTNTLLFDLPANAHITGDQTTFLNSNPNGVAIFPDPLMQAGVFVGSRLYKTTGSITSGQATLTVASTTGIQVGTRIGVWGGTTSNANQQTTINQGGGIGTGDASFFVISTSGWDLTRANDLILLEIQSELITCTGGTGVTFTGCTRGVFGTTAATHINGSNVTHAGVFLAQVLSIAGNVLTLDTNAGRTVTNATVWAGADHVQIDGKLTIDGAQSQTGTDNSMPCVLGPQATHFIVGQGVTLRRCEHGGFFIYGGMLNDFAGGVEYTGKPPNRLGADVWAFASSIKNNFHPAFGINGDAGFFFDDRTGNVDPWVGNSNGNTFRGTSLENYTTCVLIEGGSSDNEVSLGKCKATLATAQAILIDSAQWTSNPQPNPNNNHVSVGTIDATGQVALTTAFYLNVNSNNKIDVGMIQGGTVALANAGDTVTFRDAFGYHVVGEAQSTALPTISRASLIADTNPTMGTGTFKGYAVLGVCRGFNDAAGDKCYGGWFKATAPNNTSTEVGLHAESADSGGRIYEFGTTAALKEILNGDGGHLLVDQANAPVASANTEAYNGDLTSHSVPLNYNAGGITNFWPKTVALTADWSCGTGGTVASCTSATIIGSGGGVPMTFTLPLATNSFTLTCDGVVSQTTALTANQWNLLTATNGASNVTTYYFFPPNGATAPTLASNTYTTDQGSTTTTFQIGGNWTLGALVGVAKYPFHILAKIEGASASGTVLSLQLLAPTVGDLVTIYRGMACTIF